jgi:outer membrane lipoprotein-sorting protein
MKSFAIPFILGGGMMLAATFAPEAHLDKQAAILKDAKSLKVVCTFQHIPGTKAEYTLTYSKPNMLLIVGPDRVVESDGTTLWEYDKTAKTYTETPFSAEMLARRAQSDEVIAWASFFTDSLMKNITSAQTGGARSIKGSPTTEVTFTTGSTNPKTVTLFIDDKLGVARGMAMKAKDGDVLVQATTIELGAEPMAADKFTFAAPADAKKVEAPKPDPNGWATVQPVFASNCSPCHAGGRGKGGFSIASYQAVMKGSDAGSLIVAGDPDNSRLIQLITGQAQPKMPQGRDMSQADIDKLKAWIKAGAKE